MPDTADITKPFARLLEYYMYKVRFPPITANRLARELGVNPQTVLNWRKGISIPEPDMLQLLATRTGMPFSLLWRAAGHQPIAEHAATSLSPEVILDLERESSRYLAEAARAENRSGSQNRESGRGTRRSPDDSTSFMAIVR
ncbi:MAG TPA: helix-turn-helix transcriptional regulator [Ktedonobacterales bacterium]|nr:helix-turn-helix transcriptional regulator [Ktedonobacterales bacterium]